MSKPIDLSEALLLVADWVEAGLSSGRLDHYYWGYAEVASELRDAAGELNG